MDLVGPFILLRVYLDAFCANTPIGSVQHVCKKIEFNPEKNKFLLNEVNSNALGVQS
jgi:hypothetical protein